MCISYPGTLKLMDDLSETHTVPLKKWIEEKVVFKFWGDNVDKQRRVRDLRSDNSGEMVHMFSILVGRSRTPAPELPHGLGNPSLLDGLCSDYFLPSSDDVRAIKENLVKIISRILTKNISWLTPLAKYVPQHILHHYSREMAQKSEVYALDVLMKNEAKHADMIEIMRKIQGYLGEEYDGERRVASGGDQLTCERQVGAQRLTSCANTSAERLQLLEPVTEDWHCLVSIMRVSGSKNIMDNTNLLNLLP